MEQGEYHGQAGKKQKSDGDFISSFGCWWPPAAADAGSSDLKKDTGAQKTFFKTWDYLIETTYWSRRLPFHLITVGFNLFPHVLTESIKLSTCFNVKGEIEMEPVCQSFITTWIILLQRRKKRFIFKGSKARDCLLSAHLGQFTGHHSILNSLNIDRNIECVCVGES